MKETNQVLDIAPLGNSNNHKPKLKDATKKSSSKNEVKLTNDSKMQDLLATKIAQLQVQNKDIDTPVDISGKVVLAILFFCVALKS